METEDIYYKGACISYNEDTKDYDVIFGHSENGVDCVCVAPCDTITNAKSFIDMICNGDFDDDDTAYEYACHRWSEKGDDLNDY